MRTEDRKTTHLKTRAHVELNSLSHSAAATFLIIYLIYIGSVVAGGTGQLPSMSVIKCFLHKPPSETTLNKQTKECVNKCVLSWLINFISTHFKSGLRCDYCFAAVYHFNKTYKANALIQMRWGLSQRTLSNQVCISSWAAKNTCAYESGPSNRHGWPVLQIQWPCQSCFLTGVVFQQCWHRAPV